jgi:hypothetical protein
MKRVVLPEWVRRTLITLSRLTISVVCEDTPIKPAVVGKAQEVNFILVTMRADASGIDDGIREHRRRVTAYEFLGLKFEPYPFA